MLESVTTQSGCCSHHSRNVWSRITRVGRAVPLRHRRSPTGTLCSLPLSSDLCRSGFSREECFTREHSSGSIMTETETVWSLYHKTNRSLLSWLMHMFLGTKRCLCYCCTKGDGEECLGARAFCRASFSTSMSKDK